MIDDGIFTAMLAVALLTFLFWDDPDGLDNWDRLDVIIHAQYYEVTTR